jgi:hypothetical protein
LIMSRTQWGCVAVAVIAKSGCGWESGSGWVAVLYVVGKRGRRRSFWYQTHLGLHVGIGWDMVDNVTGTMGMRMGVGVAGAKSGCG